MNGQYQNEVPWLVVYEPVVKTYLKERTTVLAFTATEYAMAQKLGYFNFKGGSELVWLKWHTPDSLAEVTINVQLTGNSNVYLESGGRSAIITGKVVDLNQNVPPNPTANDRNDNFMLSSPPIKADKTTAEWGTYEARWIPDWVWHADWESDWRYIPWYEWFFAGNGWEYLYVEHYWKDFGRLGG